MAGGELLPVAEAVGSLALGEDVVVDDEVPVDVLEPVAVDDEVPVDVLEAVVVDDEVPVDVLEAVAVDGEVPVDVFEPVVVDEALADVPAVDGELPGAVDELADTLLTDSVPDVLGVEPALEVVVLESAVLELCGVEGAAAASEPAEVEGPLLWSA